MTGDESGKDLIYDAWNRLVEVEDDQDVTLVAYSHDAMNRRVTQDDGDLRVLYYSSQWQVLEERLEGDTDIQYVWSPVYIDAMVLRDRDTDGNGSLDERFYVQQDGNYNVTAIVDASGDVQERYIQDAYGAVTVLDEDWSTLGGSAFAWVYLHQGGRFQLVTGLYHFRNRELSATLGRWIQVDPIGYHEFDPNLMGYVANNPLTYADPVGQKPTGVRPGIPPNPLPPGDKPQFTPWDAWAQPGSWDLFTFPDYEGPPGTNHPITKADASAACDYLRGCGATVTPGRPGSLSALCKAIQGLGVGRPFSRISIVGHCGGPATPGVKVCPNERFDCSSVTPECAKIIRRALVPGGVLRLCSCGYPFHGSIGLIPVAFLVELACIAKKIGNDVSVCACTGPVHAWWPPSPTGGGQKSCHCTGRWICVPPRRE